MILAECVGFVPIATNAPKFFLFPPLFLPPSHPSWYTSPPPMIDHGELRVLTAHIREEEEQTQDICGK